jgi:protocatechuate 3,4-dioxygenase alpha subunit
MILKQTPSQTVGPYFAYGLTPEQYVYDYRSMFSGAIADARVPGEHIVIEGRVLDGNGAAIGDAMLEFLQASPDGRYVEAREEIARTGFRGFARVGTGTDPEQRYIIRTVRPGATGDGSAPHVDVIVFMRGMLTHAFTRIYFEDEPANADDPVLASVPEERRRTLIARRAQRPGETVYRFDFRMQGQDETVFFDL